MALSLDQIAEKKDKKTLQDKVVTDEKKTVRPWSKNESSSNIYAGQMAFQKSQNIKNKNNSLVEELRMQASPKNIQSIENLIRAKELEFENLEKVDTSFSKIKTNKGLIYKLKNMFLN